MFRSEILIVAEKSDYQNFGAKQRSDFNQIEDCHNTNSFAAHKRDTVFVSKSQGLSLRGPSGRTLSEKTSVLNLTFIRVDERSVRYRAKHVAHKR